jgi:hypothetical protein
MWVCATTVVEFLSEILILIFSLKFSTHVTKSNDKHLYLYGTSSTTPKTCIANILKHFQLYNRSLEPISVIHCKMNAWRSIVENLLNIFFGCEVNINFVNLKMTEWVLSPYPWYIYSLLCISGHIILVTILGTTWLPNPPSSTHMDLDSNLPVTSLVILGNI